ncbi:hypothetical protein SNEBB_007442 [Seison nebaliae]|nr:hypothetical protein SNEBB_007442 [Seison nebaliae]
MGKAKFNCCDQITKILLLLILLILILLGITVLAFGILLTATSKIADFATTVTGQDEDPKSKELHKTGIIILIFGLLLATVMIVGCCGACHSSFIILAVFEAFTFAMTVALITIFIIVDKKMKSSIEIQDKFLILFEVVFGVITVFVVLALILGTILTIRAYNDD